MTGANSDPVALLDAVCCVQFCAASKHGLLLAILVRLNWEILVPGEVSNEVLDKAYKYPTAKTPWKRFIANDRVRVLDPIDLERTDQADVREVVARLRGTSEALALGKAKDLGEHVVVGYGVVLCDAGRRVFVLIDDQGAQDLAAEADLEVVDMERLLLLGHKLGLPELETKAKVKAVYEQLRPYGGSLKPWNASWLKTQL